MLSPESLAAVLLICAGIVHNYSFMCRKLPAETLQTPYPKSALGKILFDLSWILLAAYGLLLTFQLSTVLSMVAAGIYFFILPFVLQPPLARLLGFKSLTDFVNSIDDPKQRP